jgi:cytosine/adenosine deaminase-related metal-dependent hydrolase
MSRSIHVAILATFSVLAYARSAKLPTHGKRYARLAIRNATIIDGNGTPAAGPKDIIIENDRIVAVVPFDTVALQNGRGGKRMPADAEIDATGKYVLPGLINAHAHTQDERGGIPQPVDYELKIWLACGITTVRDAGSDTKKTLALKAKSATGEIAAPRFLVYPMFNAQQPVPTTPEQARARIREYKQMGADGVKFLGMYRDIMEAAEDEAHKLNLRSRTM